MAYTRPVPNKSALPWVRVWTGGALVIVSGLYLIWRERALHIELAAAIEAPGR
jgi:hypothetical protein